MSSLAKSLVFQDQGPQCCKGDDSPENPSGGKCDLNDGEPVGANSGNLLDSRVDLVVPGKEPFGVTAYYNSDNPYMGHLGFGWSSILGVRLFHWPDSSWSLRDPYGRREDFTTSGGIKSRRFYWDSLHIANDTAALRVDEHVTYVFDRRDGTLRSVHDDQGFGYNLSYDASAAAGTQADPTTGRLKYPIRGVSDYAVPRGMRATIAMDFRVASIADKTFPTHIVAFAYDTSGMVASATDHSGRVVRYAYDFSGNLMQVTGVDSSLQRYRFLDSAGLHRVTSFDPFPVGASDTVDTTRWVRNKWDGLGRVSSQSSGATQTYNFDRNPYSVSCTDQSASKAINSTWSETCSYVRSTTVTRNDDNGIGRQVSTYRIYVDSVQNLTPMQKSIDGVVTQVGDQTFSKRWITLTETVGRLSVVYRLIFDDQNNVKQVIRPDGTKMDLWATESDPGTASVALGPYVSGVHQSPPSGLDRTDASLYDLIFGYREVATSAYQTGSPYTYRTDVLKNGTDVAYTRYQYGSDVATARSSFDALGRVDSVFGFQGLLAKAWYASASSSKPDSLTYTDGSGVRYTRDALGQILSVRDGLGRTSTYRYSAKGDIKLACGPDSLCVRQSWRNRALVRTESGLRLLPDGTYTAPLATYVYRVDAQKRTTHTYRLVGADSILIQKRLMDVWGNVWAVWTNSDTANAHDTSSSYWIQTETNTYDARNRLTQHKVLVNTAMQTTNYTWDVLGHLTSVQDAHGVYTHVVQDAYGNLVQRKDTLGRTWSSTFNERGLPLTETDPMGRTVTHTWNHLGEETQRIGWRNDTTRWIWNHDRLMANRSPEGRWTTFGYDTLGRLVRATAKVGDSLIAPDANDLTTTWTYDKSGNRVSETVAGRKTHGWLVDGAGKILADTNALGLVTRYLYDNLGQVTSVLSPAGDTLAVSYDNRGNANLARVGKDTLVQMRSNNLGLPVWMRRPGQGTVASTFNAMGYLQSVTDSTSRSFNFRQDAFGADSLVSGNAINRQVVRDPVGRLQKVLDEKSQATLFAWDNADRLQSVTTPSGLVTTYAYLDSANGWQRRTTTRTDGVGTKSETHVWDRDGLLRRFTDGRGVSALYSYDSLARMTGIAYTNPDGSAAGPAKAFRYTPEGWTRAMVFGTVTDSFTYDGTGRVLQSFQTIGTTTYTTEHRYDDKNRLDTLITPDGVKSWRRTDDRGRTVALWRNGVRMDTLVWQGTNRMSRTLGNGIVATYAYDADGRDTSLSYTKSGTQVLGYKFGYTVTGKLAWQQRLHAPAQSETYTWTPDGLLWTASRGAMDASHWIASPTWTKSYSNDPSGNPASGTNGFGELATLGSLSFTWDAAGNLTNDGTQSLTWTPDGRLSSAGNEGFVYDALGRIAQRTLAGGATVNMVWDGWREVYSSSTTGETVTRLWGNYLDEEVAEVHKTGTTAESVQYPLTGNNWNTEALTDASGAIVRAYLVDPYGNFAVYTSAGTDGKWWTGDDVAGTAASLDGERIFQGLAWYGATGLYYARQRWYSPSMQRFVSVDKMGFESGDANLYRFERNNPLGNLDPMGNTVWNKAFGFRLAKTAGLSFAAGAGLGAAMVFATPAVATVAAITGAVLLTKAVVDAAAKGYELATGKDFMGRTLCPGQKDNLARDLIADAVGLAAGIGGGGLGAGLASGAEDEAIASGLMDAASEESGTWASAGDDVAAAESDAGLAPEAMEGAPDGVAGVEPPPQSAGSMGNPDYTPPSGPNSGSTNLASAERTQHILYGDGPGTGGHLFPGQPGKSAFPQSWTPEKVMHSISDVATDPALTWRQQTGIPGSMYTKLGTPAKFVVEGVREGVNIRVIIQPMGEGIITGFPVN